MMISTADQLLRLFWFLGFGAVLCLYSTLFRLWRVLMTSRPWQVFLQDIILCVTGGVMFFLFSLSLCGGTLRASHLAAAALGFAATQLVINIIARFLNGLQRRIFCPLRRACADAVRIPGEKARNFAKKVGVFFKKGLHSILAVVYNRRTHK